MAMDVSEIQKSVDNTQEIVPEISDDNQTIEQNLTKVEE